MSPRGLVATVHRRLAVAAVPAAGVGALLGAVSSSVVTGKGLDPAALLTALITAPAVLGLTALGCRAAGRMLANHVRQAPTPDSLRIA